MPFGLSQTQIDSICQILCAHRGVERVVLYGSRALGRHKQASDIDLTLVAPNLKLSELLAIANEMDDLNMPYKVDLSLFHMIDSESLKEHIQRVGITFCEKLVVS